MDESVAALGESRELARIPVADQDEVQWARRTLHEYVAYNVHRPAFISPMHTRR